MNTGAMIALIPSDADLDRLALPDGEPRDQLHMTLWFLGEAADMPEHLQSAILRETEARARDNLRPVDASAFAVNLFNPNSDDSDLPPAWVLGVGGEGLREVRDEMRQGMVNAPDNVDAQVEESQAWEMPPNHDPWVPHVTLVYDTADEIRRMGELRERLGPVTFDRVRVAYGDDVIDYPLGGGGTVGTQEASVEVDLMPYKKVKGHDSCPDSKPWAVVNSQTGDVKGCHASEDKANAQLGILARVERGEPVPSELLDVLEMAEEDCPPGQHKMPDGTCMPDHPMAVEPDKEVAAVSTAEVDEVVVSEEGRWTGVLAVEGVPTGDGREFGDGSLEWRDLPLSLYWQRMTADGHERSAIVGSIDQIWRDGSRIRGSGRFNLNAPEGGQSRQDAWDAYQLVKDKFMRGVSVTLDDVQDNDVEMIWPEDVENEPSDNGDAAKLFAKPEKVIFNHGRIIDATLTGQPALQEAFIEIVEDGVEPTPEPVASTVMPVHSTATSDGPWDTAVNLRRLGELNEDVVRQVFAWVRGELGAKALRANCLLAHHDVDPLGRVGPANLTACASGIGQLNGARGGVAIPTADREAVYEHLAQHLHDAGREPQKLETPEDAAQLALVAAAISAPVAPPAVWFANPQFDEITPLMVGDDGWVRGHLARWGVCHTSFPGTCVTPPHEDEFSYFTTGELATREGTRVPVGQLTLGTGHAPAGLGARPAAVHYDHTGYAVADVAAGADAHGIWVAGALCPDVDEITVRRLRASALSGDWRRIGGALRLVAALVVNVPGFPIPRTKTRTTDGVQTALVAAGVVSGAEERPSSTLTPEQERLIQIGIETLTAEVNAPVVARLAEQVEV